MLPVMSHCEYQQSSGCQQQSKMEIFQNGMTFHTTEVPKEVNMTFLGANDV